MEQSIQINLDDKEQLIKIGKAFSSSDRIELLGLLEDGNLNVNEISEKLHIPPSSAALHVKVLEDAGLIKSELLPAVRGSMKVCRKCTDLVEIKTSSQIGTDHVEVINMPIGSFVDYKVVPTCGIVSTKGPIGNEDEPRCFYHQDRGNAALLWFGHSGYVEYRFPNHILKKTAESKIELSFEICSEDNDYNMDYPSDITLWVNGVEAGTWNCPSDFGGRRGKWNPEWWPEKNSQYGKLKTWTIDQSGCYIDGEKAENTPLSGFSLNKNDFIAVRIGVKDDAVHKGGLNLFGENFGDFAQGIRMAIYLKDKL